MSSVIDRLYFVGQRTSALPPIALWLGILSGPATLVCGLFLAQVYDRYVEVEADALAFLLNCASTFWIGGSLLLSISCLMNCSHSKLDRRLSLIGLLATIVWLIAYCAFLLIASSTMYSGG
jgi:hypothetical protein